MDLKTVLVTGATGFLGAHVVDSLLERGLCVCAAVRSEEKAEALKEARKRFVDDGQLKTVKIGDLTSQDPFKEAVKGVDAVIHCASPVNYDIKDNEKELLLPAIKGTEAIMKAAHEGNNVKRIVVTSSFAAVLDASRGTGPGFTYTGKDWNPITYKESLETDQPPIAYRGAKTFAEKAAWDFISKNDCTFDVVTLCPPMIFGPCVHPIKKISELNMSNGMLWDVASGKDMPVARVPVWVDVRDVAEAHVAALLTKDAGGKRYIPCAPEKFSYPLAAQIMKEDFPWTRQTIKTSPDPSIPPSYELDGESVSKELGIKYKTFRQTIDDTMKTFDKLEKS